MPKKSSKRSKKHKENPSVQYLWLVATIFILAMSSYLAEVYGDAERSLGPRLFYYQVASLVRPFSPRLHMKEATIYDQTGRYLEADRLLSNFPETNYSELQLAQVRIHERHFPEAGETLTSLNQNNSTVQMLRAWVAFGEGDISRAQSTYLHVNRREVGESFRDDSDLLAVLVALPDGQKAERLLPTNLGEILKPWVDQINSYVNPTSRGLETAELYRSLSMPRPALTMVRSVISTNSEYVPAIEESFYINQELGQTRAAQGDLVILQKLNPTHKY